MPRALLAKSESAGQLAQIRGQLAELQPDLLTGDRDRLKRSLAQQQAAKLDAAQSLAAARALLASDGTRDPEAALALAEARAASSAEHLATVRRRAEAIQKLDSLFRTEQGRLADQFTAPLAERITGYLRCLFGPDAFARVRLDGEKFGGLELVRNRSEAFGFEQLSGGTREQLAAAVRLAMAEILAADHDGCLPLFFDDAFAHSDPERVQILQRMLDLAATRGLQVVVLSCTPADYAALGARQHLLTRPTRQAHAAAPLPAGDPTDEDDGTEAPPASPSDPAAETALLDYLRDLGGSAGNQKLRETLGWDEARYNAVKDSLTAQGRVTPGRGRGGSVAIA